MTDALPPPSPLTGRRPEPETLVTATGPLGGPSYSHRGAVIDCQPGGHVCRLRMPGHPLDETSFGSPGTIPYLVDLWLDHQRLPPWIRLVEKKG
jgi:hypothetical protein